MLTDDEGSTITMVTPMSPDLPDGTTDVQPQRPPASAMATPPNIQALTRAVRKGDADAFSCFYDLYSFRLYKFILVLARGDETEAHEVCQAVFIKLAKRCDVFDDERRLWGWLRVLAKNTFIDHCRSRQRLSRFVPLNEMSAEPDGRVNSEHRLSEIVREALAALPPEERELVQAAYVDKRPLGELAKKSGQTYKAVESRLGRLRRKLKEQLLNELRHENES